MPPCRGEGMTDSPSRDLSTIGRSAQEHALRPPTPTPWRGRTTDPLSPLPPACAVRRRRPGPPAASRSALRADPGPRRLSRRATRKPKNSSEKINNKNYELTGPAPSGMTDPHDHVQVA